MFIALVRCRLFCTWGWPGTQPAVLLTAYPGSLSFSPSSRSPALQNKAGKCRQLQFPSCCLRQEQIFPSLQHNKGFGHFSASFAILGDWTPSRLGVVHVLKELSMPLATHIFPTCMDRCSKQTRRAGGGREHKPVR